MNELIEWFLNGMDEVLSASALEEVAQCLAIIIPTVICVGGVAAMLWLFFGGVFKK